MNKCTGIGRIFGHKFIHHGLTRSYVWEFCFRCGKKVGQ